MQRYKKSRKHQMIAKNRCMGGTVFKGQIHVPIQQKANRIQQRGLCVRCMLTVTFLAVDSVVSGSRLHVDNNQTCSVVYAQRKSTPTSYRFPGRSLV
ncbi:hypothetical protein BaRGS_00039460 [Batillaria attramentaria]|uniref:Uncharacterized protein n=1 Tax=Batillaria attramentaria TaxID=370345 RepID=A0ABD0J2W1_9CAEN